jgi:alkylhydroperoxidase family enzyme
VCRETLDSDTDHATVPEGLEPGWIAALCYAETVRESGHAVSDAMYEELKGFWSDGEIVEMTLVIGLFSYFNRFNDALRVAITR